MTHRPAPFLCGPTLCLWLVVAGCAPSVATTVQSDRMTTAGSDASAQPVVVALTTAAPEDVGMSGEVLARIGPAVQQALDEGQTGGILTLVARRGEIVHWDAQGWRVLDEDPLEPTDVFRIYSMTKPVVSVAAMMLVEDGRLSLDDPVARHIPAFADVQVYDGGTLRAPVRPMVVRHLFSHTSGLTYGVFGDTPVDSIYRQQGDLLWTHSGRSLEETANVIASLPLIDDPGARWNYSVSTDVLGRVVEVASGMSLDAFLQERIFEPLGMRETAFHVPAERRDRLTAVYGPGDGGLRTNDSPATSPFTRPPTWHSGGGGLTSTASDYLRFSQMLLNGGQLDGVRILESSTVDEMRRNHLPEDMIPIGPAWPDTGFGLGFAVRMETAEQPDNYFWLGAANTYFWIDPDDELIVFAWTQFEPALGAQVDRIVRPIVYEAIVDGR